MKITVAKRCNCSRITAIEVEEEPFTRFVNGEKIQNALPMLNSFERETLITGMCFDCQSKLFHNPKPGEDWGPLMGECPECGCPIYPIDIKDNVCECASCGSRYKADTNGIDFSKSLE